MVLTNDRNPFGQIPAIDDGGFVVFERYTQKT